MKKKKKAPKWGTCLVPGKCQGARVRFRWHGGIVLSALCKRHWKEVWKDDPSVELVKE